MSRRESRVSINVRQNDALFEFEAFKKKFLLANKAITKLNSTLSVRIEELNTQISSLYVENLRLRASEIALGAQLKREREKSMKIMAGAEAATLNLTKHLGFLRDSFDIRSTSTPPPSPPPPRASRPVLNPQLSPINRLSRPPNIPGIYEEDEAAVSSSDERQELEKLRSPVRRRKPKPRLSASRLPLPSRVSSPPPLPTTMHYNPIVMEDPVLVDQAGSTQRKPTRRRSGLLNVDTEGYPRPLSPAFGSPISKEIALAEQEEVTEAEAEVDVETLEEALARIEKKKGKIDDRLKHTESGRKRARARSEEDEGSGVGGNGVTAAVEGSNLKLKDVTNSPRNRTPLPLTENTNNSDRERPDTGGQAFRAFLSSPTPSPPGSQIPTPPTSSSPAPPPSSETDAAMNGRERRTRKSVNYAEPKLNTKMRKPDPAPGMNGAKKRSSAATSILNDGNEGDVDSGTRSSLDAPLSDTSGKVKTPLPTLFIPHLYSAEAPSTSTATAVRRKKSRPYLFPSDEESDGTQADAETGYGGASRSSTVANGWVNVESRRRSGQSGNSGVIRKVIVHDVGRVEMDEVRRHSMAV